MEIAKQHWVFTTWKCFWKVFEHRYVPHIGKVGKQLIIIVGAKHGSNIAHSRSRNGSPEGTCTVAVPHGNSWASFLSSLLNSVTSRAGRLLWGMLLLWDIWQQHLLEEREFRGFFIPPKSTSLVSTYWQQSCMSSNPGPCGLCAKHTIWFAFLLWILLSGKSNIATASHERFTSAQLIFGTN